MPRMRRGRSPFAMRRWRRKANRLQRKFNVRWYLSDDYDDYFIGDILWFRKNHNASSHFLLFALLTFRQGHDGEVEILDYGRTWLS